MKTMEDYNKILVIFVFFIFMFNENIIYANGGEMKINKIDISSFIYRSDHIFVGKVIDLMEIENVKVAKFKVSKIIKGKTKVKILYFLAQGTSNADRSTAHKNEKLFLCLSKFYEDIDKKFLENRPKFNKKLKKLVKDSLFLRITAKGLGRMRIKKIDRRQYIEVSSLDITIPEHIENLPDTKLRTNQELLSLEEITKYFEGKIKEKEEILKQINTMQPKDTDFKFEIPQGWSNNFMTGAKIIDITEGESIENAKSIIDNNPATTWTSKKYKPGTVITIDLGKKVQFNRIIIFNRHTEMRGTAGGNNSVKEMEILTSPTTTKEDLKHLIKLELEGPRGTCIKKDTGQVCFFIDNTEPQIFEIEEAEARLIRIKLISAFWGRDIPDDWRSSFALSEIMLFHNR